MAEIHYKSGNRLTNSRSWLPPFVWLCLSGCLFPQWCQGQDDSLRRVQRTYNQKIKPILEQNCNDCHSGNAADAGLDLSKFPTIRELLNARKTWKKVQVRVAAREMPPEDCDPLTKDDHHLVIDWIDNLLNSVDCTTIHPGNVTIRRLNRSEYRNTIRDLFGVDYQPADAFPGDDVGYGFDNIADVLSLPPLLMEKYLDAAEKITAMAIVDPDKSAFNQTLDGKEFVKHEGSYPLDFGHILASQGVITKKVVVPQTGTYNLVVETYGQHAGEGLPEVTLEINNRKVGKKKVKGTEAKPSTIAFSARIKSGGADVGVGFENDFYDESLPRDQRDRNLVILSVTISGPNRRLPESHRKIVGKDVPDSTAEQRIAARRVINRIASQAFRRRATKSELDRLLGFYDEARRDGDRHEIALRYPLQAVLVSPYFLYRVEAATENGKQRFLTDFELATNLAFFLWGTMPDLQLFALADSQGLKDAKVYKEQIKRMLADPRAESLVENFAAQWLQLRHLQHVVPDPDLFPGVDAKLLEDMATETKMVIADLILRDASILELLETDYTFVNERLARHYGYPDVRGDSFRRVSTKAKQRFGLMTQASILTLTSNPERTSPVKRGKWIMENLLGEEPPPPDPEAMQLEDQKELKGTLRQRMEQHRSNPNCAVCHKVMDELGFALENYDAVGKWRTKDGSNRIDAHGELPDGTKFEGAQQLQGVIRNKMRKQFVRCLTEKMLIYALGRGLEYYDECAIDKIIQRLEANDHRFSELILGIVTSEPFLKRAGIDE